LFHAIAWAVCVPGRTQALPGSKTTITVFSRLAREFAALQYLEEHLFRSVICQAVILTRWEQNK
jgi:hypothetical protein